MGEGARVRRGERTTGRTGDGAMGRVGDGASGRWGEWAMGRVGDGATCLRAVIPAKAGIHEGVLCTMIDSLQLSTRSFPRRRESMKASFVPCLILCNSPRCHSREGGNPWRSPLYHD